MRSMTTAALVLATGLVLGLAAGAGAGPPSMNYTATLNPLNDSGASGTARLELEGDQLTVTVDAEGLAPGEVHPQHIHGLDHKNAACPDTSFDKNGDGLIQVGEGAMAFGPVRIALEPFPEADARGKIHFEKTFTIKPADLRPLQSRVVVLHGMTVNGTYDATLPVACGQIRVATPEAEQGQGSGGY